MKRKVLFILLLCAVAVLCALSSGDPLWLPLAAAAGMLRRLSLSGSLGNAIACSLFALFGLIPLLLKNRKKWYWEDILLVLTAPAIWFVLYYQINPGLLPQTLAMVQSSGNLSICVWSLLVGWAVLRLLRMSGDADSSQLYRMLRLFLILCAAVCVLSVIIKACLLPDSIAAIKAANTMPGLQLGTTFVFLGLGFAVLALECFLDAWVLLRTIPMLKHLEANPYSAECCTAAQKVARLCRRVMTVIVITSTGFNLAQVFFASRLHAINISLRIPLTSLALVFALMALCKLLSRGKTLQEEADLFI